ncbi:MAG TPA: alkaline phosphatase family protein [Actinomycetota bacterium]|nr:alkaline phosphatase family protein [Actinomycetota bacterium]
MTLPKIVTALVVAVCLVALGIRGYEKLTEDPPPSFRAQACGLPERWLEMTKRGYYPPRSGQISLLPRTPAYMASGGDGWSHSGPWPYLQDIPLVFYGPGIVPPTGNVDRPVTLADVAPTFATLMKGSLAEADGASLPEVAGLDEGSLTGPNPKLILTIVWDGGGWNTLEQWPGDWSNLLTLMEEGVSYTRATVGSSPSVTPAVHSTLGTGVFPWEHGITGVPVRDEEGEVVDAFLEGESSRFLQVPALAERWDEQNDNRALIGMLGYEPWHLGMIGKGAEKAGGDHDDAVWLNVETNEWATNPEHYRLPPSVEGTEGLEEDLAALDAEDGEVDDAWLGNDILDRRDRIEETPAFIEFHTRALENMILEEGYGRDGITDLLFTNYKQIDRLGHYFNMDSEEVNAALLKTDQMLGRLVSFLDENVGRGEYVVVVTADHGQQPDSAAVDGYGIDPNEVERDIDEAFGPITRAVWPTEAFLLEDAMEERGVTVDEVARWLADYRIEANNHDGDELGRFSSSDRAFEMVIPSRMLTDITC